jgi:hypothetical protein
MVKYKQLWYVGCYDEKESEPKEFSTRAEALESEEVIPIKGAFTSYSAGSPGPIGYRYKGRVIFFNNERDKTTCRYSILGEEI